MTASTGDFESRVSLGVLRCVEVDHFSLPLPILLASLSVLEHFPCRCVVQDVVELCPVWVLASHAPLILEVPKAIEDRDHSNVFALGTRSVLPLLTPPSLNAVHSP